MSSQTTVSPEHPNLGPCGLSQPVPATVSCVFETAELYVLTASVSESFISEYCWTPKKAHIIKSGALGGLTE